MSLSLREQLLKAGLVSEKQAKKVSREQQQQEHQKQHQQSKHKPAPLTEQQRAAQQAQAAKVARDQELNRKKLEKAEKRARMAQIKQLIEENKVPRVDTEDYYNFIDGKRIKRMPVNAELRDQITRGVIVIARCDGRYDLVPAAVAERIKERDERAVIPYVAADQSSDVDEAYKEFVVPDDLKW